MLFDNAQLEPGETMLVQAAGSGIGTVAMRIAKAIGCTVIATAGDDEKCAKAKALGADHVVNYSDDRTSRPWRGASPTSAAWTWCSSMWARRPGRASLLSLRMGGRLVTCGSTSGVSAETNLMMLFQRQLRIFGSFGAAIEQHRRTASRRWRAASARCWTPSLPLERFTEGLERLESRRVFGKIVVTL